MLESNSEYTYDIVSLQNMDQIVQNMTHKYNMKMSIVSRVYACSVLMIREVYAIEYVQDYAIAMSKEIQEFNYPMEREDIEYCLALLGELRHLCSDLFMGEKKVTVTESNVCKRITKLINKEFIQLGISNFLSEKSSNINYTEDSLHCDEGNFGIYNEELGDREYLVRVIKGFKLEGLHIEDYKKVVKSFDYHITKDNSKNKIHYEERAKTEIWEKIRTSFEDGTTSYDYGVKDLEGKMKDFGTKVGDLDEAMRKMTKAVSERHEKSLYINSGMDGSKYSWNSDANYRNIKGLFK